jgi:hypothetical protein
MAQPNVEAFRLKDLRQREHRVAALKRRFGRASGRNDGRVLLSRVGRPLLVAYWAACLAVLGWGAIALHPEFGRRVAYALADPAMELTAPFPNCAAAHAAGYSDIPVGSPAYTTRQDGDLDGLACEPYPHSSAGERLSKIWRRWQAG